LKGDLKNIIFNNFPKNDDQLFTTVSFKISPSLPKPDPETHNLIEVWTQLKTASLHKSFVFDLVLILTKSFSGFSKSHLSPFSSAENRNSILDASRRSFSVIAPENPECLEKFSETNVLRRVTISSRFFVDL